MEDLPARVDAETIAAAVGGVEDLEQHRMAVPPGGKLRLFWPLACDFRVFTASPRLLHIVSTPSFSSRGY